MGWLGLRLSIGKLPDGVTIAHLFGVALLAGMGFTLSLFVAGLAFPESPEALLDAKAGILVGSLLAAAGGISVLRLLGGRGAAQRAVVSVCFSPKPSMTPGAQRALKA